MHCGTVRGEKWRVKREESCSWKGFAGLVGSEMAALLLQLPHTPSSAPFSLGMDHYIFSFSRCSNSCPFSATLPHPAPSLLNPYRSRPRYRHGAGVAAPSLRRLPVLLVGSFEHLLHVSDLVLAHGRHVHVTPERQRRRHRKGEWARETVGGCGNQRG